MFTGKKGRHMTAAEREKLIWISILTCVEEHGVFRFTLEQVALQAKCSVSTVKNYYPGGITGIRSQVLKYAMENHIQEILDTPITDLIKS